jgi:hypothetical protein
LSVNGTRHYDAAIIGAGQGGKPLTIAMAASGISSHLVPPRGREKISGEEDVFKTVLVDSELPKRRNRGAEDQTRFR